MKKKIEETIKYIEQSETISQENKPAIIEKLHEWREEEHAVNDVTSRFQTWWAEVEPIFAELGWI